MRMAHKSWLSAGLLSLFLAGCTNTTTTETPAPQQPAYNGPVEEISGAEPRYEPLNPATSQDYSVNGTKYKVVQDPSNFSQVGYATSYGEENGGNMTAIGEQFDPNAMTAAHATLPLPSYVRVTNLANGRRLVVRLNDRGPYTSGKVIDLSRAAADRLNISNNTKVRIDFINVAPDGTMSGPGTIGTTIAKQSYALPSRPTIGQETTQVSMSPSPSDTPVAVRPVANPTPAALESDGDMPVSAPASNTSGFLGAPQPLRTGVLEGSEPVAAPAPVLAPAAVAAPVASSAPAASANGKFVVQVGAVSDGARAQQWQQKLSQQFGVPGKVSPNGAMFRVQLGPFASRQEAAALQQRLASEAQQQSFIASAQ